MEAGFFAEQAGQGEVIGGGGFSEVGDAHEVWIGGGQDPPAFGSEVLDEGAGGGLKAEGGEAVRRPAGCAAPPVGGCRLAKGGGFALDPGLFGAGSAAGFNFAQSLLQLDIKLRGRTPGGWPRVKLARWIWGSK